MRWAWMLLSATTDTATTLHNANPDGRAPLSLDGLGVVAGETRSELPVDLGHELTRNSSNRSGFISRVLRPSKMAFSRSSPRTVDDWLRSPGQAPRHPLM